MAHCQVNSAMGHIVAAALSSCSRPMFFTRCKSAQHNGCCMQLHCLNLLLTVMNTCCVLVCVFIRSLVQKLVLVTAVHVDRK